MKFWPELEPLDIYEDMLGTKIDKLYPEDLAPLLYIRHRLFGIKRGQKFDHAVLDEAQDFSPFQLSVLNQLTSANSFTILGDIAQGIHENEGINGWQEFEGVFDSRTFAYFQMDKSYRSTQEIIEFANCILKQVEQQPTLAKPVFRSGDPVEVHSVAEQEQMDMIVEWVAKMKEKQAQTLALIGRTEQECIRIQQGIKRRGVESSLLTANDHSYKGGVSVLPVYLAKGLEFDAVLLTNVNGVNYPKDPLHTKLLYVGCTRALHHLCLLISGELRRYSKGKYEAVITASYERSNDYPHAVE